MLPWDCLRTFAYFLALEWEIISLYVNKLICYPLVKAGVETLANDMFLLGTGRTMNCRPKCCTSQKQTKPCVVVQLLNVSTDLKHEQTQGTSDSMKKRLIKGIIWIGHLMPCLWSQYLSGTWLRWVAVSRVRDFESLRFYQVRSSSW